MPEHGQLSPEASGIFEECEALNPAGSLRFIPDHATGLRHGWQTEPSVQCLELELMDSSV